MATVTVGRSVSSCSEHSDAHRDGGGLDHFERSVHPLLPCADVGQGDEQVRHDQGERREVVEQRDEVLGSGQAADDAQQRDQLRETVDQKRWEIILDELSRYEDLTPRQKESSTRFARHQMELRIREFKGESPLEDLLDGNASPDQNLAAA